MKKPGDSSALWSIFISLHQRLSLPMFPLLPTEPAHMLVTVAKRQEMRLSAMPTSRAAMHVRTLARPSKPFSGCRKAPSKFHIAHALKTGVNHNVPEPCWWPKHQQAGFVAPGFSAIHAKKPHAQSILRWCPRTCTGEHLPRAAKSWMAIH